LADFGVQTIKIDLLLAFRFTVIKNPCCPLQELALPGGNLRGVQIMLLRELC
jgi:hypothetical protein